jgi:AhpD family alkylhydroperoxidase
MDNRRMSRIPEHYSKFINENPEMGKAYHELGTAAMKAGPIPQKDAELIKIGISLGAGLESAVKSHCRKAAEAGATMEEIQHAVKLAVTTVGFPKMMAGLKWAEDAFKPKT